MNDIKNDKNLREAVSRREQQLPVLPNNLNERVMKSLVEPETAPKSRRLWAYAAVAAAASIALLIVFNWDKQQSPQDPVVVQRSPRHTVSPVSPISPAIVYPEAVPDEQPKEKPVSARSEDAPLFGRGQEGRLSLYSLPPHLIWSRIGATETASPRRNQRMVLLSNYRRKRYHRTAPRGPRFPFVS